ncbi:MAG: branched-chain amino acid ABC transporter permease [Candidatus Aenigmatarchaeota archaeon]
MVDAQVKLRKERIDRGIKARSDTIYALSSYRELGYLILPRFIPISAFLLLPLILGETYWSKVLFFICVYGLLALSWDFLACVGMFSLGQSLFFGTGGYLSGILNHSLKFPVLLSIPVSTIISAVLCTLIFVPVLRLRGVYFSMVTLLLPMLFFRVIEVTGILGGTHGLTDIAPLPGYWVSIYIGVFALLFALFGMRRVMGEDFGLVLQAIKDNDRAVMSSGINVYFYKAGALFIASATGAFAGAISAHYWQFVGISSFSLDYSIVPLASVVLGGHGSFAGAVLGTCILVPLSETLRNLGALRTVLYSLILIGCTLTIPEGIFHYIERKYHQFERVVKVEE